MLRALYRLLLHACAPAVRREYGRELEQVFLHCVATERARRSATGGWLAAVRGILDLLAFAARTRYETLARPPHSPPVTRRRRIVLMRDIRGALRVMRSQPFLATAIVLMLAAGIGATTAIFSVVHGVLLKPLPFPEPDRIVQIWGTRLDRGWTSVTLTEADFWDLRDRNRTFEELGALHGASFSLTGFGLPERVSAARVSVGFFRSLGVQPSVGRLFMPGEDETGRSEGLAMLAHGFWMRRFGGDHSIVGRALTLDGRPYTVVGVVPPGSPWLDEADVFVPFVRRADADRTSFEYLAIGRLNPGTSFDAGLADLQAIAKELEAQYPDSNAGLGMTVEPSRVWIGSDQLRQTLWMLLGAVGLLLLIACVNVTNLLFARASARAREAAVRTALGATRLDIVRERLTESLLYSAAGALAGWFVAGWMLSTLKSFSPGGIPRLNEVALDTWVLAFAAGTALGVGVLTGLVPALRIPLANIVPVLGQATRGTTGNPGHHRWRSFLVATEVAICFVLLVGAGLLVRSLIGVLTVDRGFQTENRMLLTVSIPRSYPEPRMQQTITGVISRIEQLPQVLTVAAVSGRPLGPGSTGLGLAAADAPDDPAAPVPWGTWRIVTKDYFRAMGIPLLAGREFTEHDVLGKPWRAIVSRRVADLLWPGQDPIGRTVVLWKGQTERPGEIIGVVGDMRERGLERDPTLAVYFPAYGTGTTSLQLVLHTRGRPQDVVPAVRTIVAAVDSSLPVSNVRTLKEVVSASVATRTLTMYLVAIFAGLALVLALAGVYGVLAYSVARRTPEIGVRIALGAEHRRILRLVIAQGLRPVVGGAIAGLAVAFWVTRWMSSLLFGVEPADPLTYGAVLIAVLAVATLACYVPARRVLTIDPATALRVE